MDINKSAAPVNDSASNVMDDAPMLFVQQPTMSSVALSPATSLALDNSQGTQPLPGAPRTEVTPQLHAQTLDALIGQQGHLHRRYSSDGSTFRSSSTAPHSRTQSVVDASEATTHSHCSTQSGLPSSRRHNPYTPVLTPLGPVGQGDAHTPHHHPNARLQNAAVEGGLISLSPHDVGVRSFEHGTPSGPSTPAVLAAVGFKEMVASSFSASTHSIIHSRQPSLASAPTTTMPSPSAPHPGPYMDYAGATPTQAYASHRHHFNAQHHPPAMMPPLAPPLAPPPYGGAWAGQQQQPDAYSGGVAYGGAVFPPPHHHHHHHHYHHYHHHHHHYFPHHAAPFPGLAHQYHMDPTDASGFRPAPVPADMAALTGQQGQGHTRRGKRGGRSKRGGGGASFAADGAVQHKRTRRGCRAGQRVKEREAQIAAVTGHGHPGVTQDDDELDGGVSDDSSDSDEA